MVLFDSFILQIRELLNEKSIKTESYNPTKLKAADKNSVLFLKDTAYELGGSQTKCVSTLAVTSDIKFNNETHILGKDIFEIKEDTPFAKVVLLEIEDIDEETAFEKIKELEHIRYQFCPEGFMTRASALNKREQIRVSKKAVKNKISFADYGDAVIGEYLKNPLVKSVELILVTDKFFDYDKLGELAEKIKDTTSALNHIFDNILFDCKSCNLKEICDEVEGMKELHMKTANIK